MAAFLMFSAVLFGGTAGAEDIPNVTAEMRTPEFWRQRAATPDRVFLSRWDLDRLNRIAYQRGYLVRPHAELPRIGRRRVAKGLEANHRELTTWKKYDLDNRRHRDPEFDASMRELTRPDLIPERVDVRYAVTLRRTELRIMPTERVMQRRPDDPGFDIMRKTMLEIGTPLAAYHDSADGLWTYVQAPVCGGWIRRDDFCWATTPRVFSILLNPGRSLVVTGRDVRVFSDPARRHELTRVSMGGRLPVIRRERAGAVVQVPARKPDGRITFREAWVRARGEVREDWLPATTGNVIAQSFRWLGTGYGWGGAGTTVDCSSFLQAVFQSLGLGLPRTSHLQVDVFGRFPMPADPKAKAERLSRLVPFRTLLEFPGHIGLYLGEVDGRHYMIHAITAYWVRHDGEDREVKVQRVIVSDLSLGAGGKSGSLLERLVAASMVD